MLRACISHAIVPRLNCGGVVLSPGKMRAGLSPQPRSLDDQVSYALQSYWHQCRRRWTAPPATRGAVQNRYRFSPLSLSPLAFHACCKRCCPSSIGCNSTTNVQEFAFRLTTCELDARSVFRALVCLLSACAGGQRGVNSAGGKRFSTDLCQYEACPNDPRGTTCAEI